MRDRTLEIAREKSPVTERLQGAGIRTPKGVEGFFREKVGEQLRSGHSLMKRSSLKSAPPSVLSCRDNPFNGKGAGNPSIPKVGTSSAPAKAARDTDLDNTSECALLGLEEPECEEGPRQALDKALRVLVATDQAEFRIARKGSKSCGGR